MKAIKYTLLGLAGVIGMLVSMFGPVKVPFAEGLAKTYYRYVLVALLIILLLIPVALGLFLYLFDANNFKTEIVQFVKERTQRELVLQGDIKVTFFPKLGLDSGKLSLSQRDSAKEFAFINNARLYVAWWPLFKRQLVFDRVEIDGIRANGIRFRDGSTNFDDLLISDEHLAPLTFDIDSVNVTNSAINWQDEASAQHVVLQNMQIETGRLADKVPSNLTASFRLNAEQQLVNAEVRLKSRLYFDRKAGRYEFADIEGTLAGKAAQIDDLKLNFAGSLDTYSAQGLLKAENIMVTASGKFGQRAVGGRLGVPKLQVEQNNWRGTPLTLDLTSSYSDETLSAAAQLPAFEFSGNSFKAAEFAVNFDFKSAAGALQGKLAGPVSIRFDTLSQLQLDAFTLNLSARHPALSGEVTASAKGNMLVDFSGQKANLGFTAKLGDSKIAGTLALKDFSHPHYTFDINANRLDLDQYIAAAWIQRFRDDATPVDPGSLKDMTLQGNLRAGEMTLAGIKASKLAAGVKIEQSTLTIAPLAARLYGGALSGSVSLAMHDTPQITVKQSVKSIQLDELLAGTASAGRLTGKGDFVLDISTTGNSVGALRKALNGRASFDLSRGSLAGIDLRAALLEGRNDLGSKNPAHIRAAKFTDQTGFSTLQATFNFKDGNAPDNTFDMKSPLIRTVGSGGIDLETGNISYRLDATVSSAVNLRTAGELAAFKGVTVPVSVSGPYAAPSFALDFGSASGGNVAQLSAAIAAKTAAQQQAITGKSNHGQPARSKSRSSK